MTQHPTNRPKIVLHLGAHKTASTHLQQSLREAGPALVGVGVRYYGPEALRKVGQTLPERFGFPFDPKNKRPDADPLAELKRMTDGADRLVLSEENFAGNFQRGWGKVPLPLYPQAADRISRLADALGQDVDVCLAVRQPSDFLASIYSQILLSGKTVSPDEFLIRNMPSEVDWSDYVRQLRKAEGVGSLTIWRYEDYADVFAAVCAALVGKTHAALVKPIEERSMPRLSEAAVGAALSRRILKMPKTRASEIATEFPTTVDNPPFELFGPELTKIATAYYQAQVAAIRDTPGVTLLQ